jgi:hypothetical protein
LSIDGIGLGEPAGGLGKVAHLARIRDQDGQLSMDTDQVKRFDSDGGH